jgi:hypothetical protein
LGTYAVFFNQPFVFKHPVDRAVRRESIIGLAHLPFYGACADLGKRLGFQAFSGCNYTLPFNLTDALGAFSWSPALVFEPEFFTAAVAFEPFKEPLF